MKIFLLYLILILSFIEFLLAREVSGIIPYPFVIQISVILLTLMVVFSTKRDDWPAIKNDYVVLMLIWLIISIMEVVNPGAAFMGWLSEIIPVALFPFLIPFCAFLIFRENKHLDIFIIIVIVCSTLGALWGIKQLHISLSNGDREFLANNPTHYVFGRLRVFSFYDNAGQFGASQAGICVTAGVL